MPRRRDAINTGAIDWGHAEALAFGSLIAEGISVRITGQDAERGTFSHRQAVLHDVNTGETYTALANIPGATGTFEIYNSPLSETAVMGFEYGFSVAAPDELVLWEAQYGDFANVAQPIVDQFISAGRSKWRQESGLVLLLPHGYEGQGPEHSSARLERYLQLAAEENMVVAYPSTPAQYFHVLRRQAMRKPLRPLVLMQPKSLLRMKEATVKLDELTNGTFRPVIDDPIDDGEARRRAASDLLHRQDLLRSHRRQHDVRRTSRSFASKSWRRGRAKSARVVDLYPNVEEVVWAQEEPKNMGAWTYVQPRLRASIGTVTTLKYVGRAGALEPRGRLCEDARGRAEADRERRVDATRRRHRRERRPEPLVDQARAGRAESSAVALRAASPVTGARRGCVGRRHRRHGNHDARADDRRASGRRRHAAHRLSSRRAATSRPRICRSRAATAART